MADIDFDLAGRITLDHRDHQVERGAAGSAGAGEFVAAGDGIARPSDAFSARIVGVSSRKETVRR